MIEKKIQDFRCVYSHQVKTSINYRIGKLNIELIAVAFSLKKLLYL